jgi:uncharacterized RDD family membrane protein YckC
MAERRLASVQPDACGWTSGPEPMAALRDPTRVVGRRCVAYLIDLVLIVVILVALFIVPGEVRTAHGGCPQPVPSTHTCFQFKTTAYLVANSAIYAFIATAIVLVALLFILPQALVGASPGKALMRIRVVGRNGAPPGVVRSIVRSLAWIVDGLTLVLPVALWAVLLTPGHRRCGDFLAGTFVVERAARGHRVQIPERTSWRWPWTRAARGHARAPAGSSTAG